MKTEKYPIPSHCKIDCIHRVKKAKYMPACECPTLVEISEKGKCLNYKQVKK